MVQLLESKVTQFASQFNFVKNKCRRDFVSAYVVSLVLCRSVQFHRAAAHLNSEVKTSSNTTRIQDFYREVEIDYLLFAMLLFTLLPAKGKIRLTIDRTEWDFGETQVNILVILAGIGDFQIPIVFELLDNKSGNSSYLDRIDLLKIALKVIPKERIGLVIGDREFIGHRWLKYLNDAGIAFCVRVPKHHKIERFEDGSIWTVEQILAKYPKGVQWSNCKVDGVWGNIEVRPTKDEDDPLFVFGTVKTELLAKLYRKRWTIEAFFQQIKGRGYNFEDTHMAKFERLKKLFAMVALSYGLCLSIGLYRHHKEKKIVKKNHGYKSNSFFRHGLDYLVNLFSQRRPGFLKELQEMVVKAAIFIQDEYTIEHTLELSG